MLKGTWEDVIDGETTVSAKYTNDIAHAVIALEEDENDAPVSKGKGEGSVILNSSPNGRANGKNATAFSNCSAQAEGSIAEGNSSYSSGRFAHSGGYYGKAAYDYSFSFGMGTATAAQGQAVFGKYNIPMVNSLLVVGNGTNGINLSTAFSVNLDGTATVGAIPIKGMDVTNKSYVDFAVTNNTSDIAVSTQTLNFMSGYPIPNNAIGNAYLKSFDCASIFAEEGTEYEEYKCKITAFVSLNQNGEEIDRITIPSSVVNLPDYGYGPSSVGVNKVDIENDKYIRSVVRRVFNGEEDDWVFVNDRGEGNYFYIVVGAANEYKSNQIASSWFGMVASTILPENTSVGVNIIDSGNEKIIMVRPAGVESITSVETFKTILSSKNLTVVYALATPEEITLPAAITPYITVSSGGTISSVMEENGYMWTAQVAIPVFTT